MFFKVIVLEKRTCNNQVITFYMGRKATKRTVEVRVNGMAFINNRSTVPLPLLAQENIEKEGVRRTYE